MKKAFIHAFLVVVIEETVRNLIPQLLPYAWFVILWFLTWELLQSTKVQKTSSALYARLGTGGRIVSFFLVAIIGAGVSITYWLTIQRVVSATKKLSEPDKLKLSDSSKGVPAPPEAAPSVNPDLARQLLEKLDGLKKSAVPESEKQTPFLISTGPALVSTRVQSSMFVVSFTELPTQSPVGPINVELAHIMLFVGVLNQQSAPTIIQGYKMEIKKKSKEWRKLQRIDTIGKRIYMTAEGRRFNSIDGNDIFDRVIYHRSFKSGDSALGWMLFKYPPDLGDLKMGEYKLRLTVYDSAGKTTTTELPIREDDAQGASLNFGPLIQLAQGQILRNMP